MIDKLACLFMVFKCILAAIIIDERTRTHRTHSRTNVLRQVIRDAQKS